MSDITQSVDQQEGFVKKYLSELKENIVGFRKIFNILKWVFVVSLGIQVLALIVFIGSGGILTAIGLLQLFYLAGVVALGAWFWSLCSDFSELQINKIQHDLRSQLSHRKDTVKTSEEILKAAKKKAGHRISSSGDNAIIMIGDGTISDVSQKKEVEGNPDLIEMLSLMISFAEEADSDEAIKSANEFAEEATKPAPDKGRLAALWATIAAVLPSILTVTKITQGVKALF